MALSIQIAWEPAIKLGPKAKFHKALVKLIDDLPYEPGIYVFARRFSKTIVPMYIGQASNGIRNRVKQQANNLSLMEGLRADKNGDRILLVGLVKLASGQQLKKVLTVAERAHIEHALTEGHQLLNIQGTKTKRHEINIIGKKPHFHPFPRTMFLAVKKSGTL